MNVKVELISDKALEQVLIECVEVTPEIDEIRSFIAAKERCVAGKLGERTVKLPLSQIMYFEAVDERVFAYTDGNVYDVRGRLYELESSFGECGFIRCSKSVLLNVYMTDSIKPELNGRFCALLKNGEKLIVSRQYVQSFKKAVLAVLGMKGGK